jgi:3-isopropylmalate/(R)-2-methylmalate dehydratase small subunit
VTELLDRAKEREGYQLTVDLESCTVTDGDGFSATFEIDPFYRYRMLNGLDDIGLTLQYADEIARYEGKVGVA